MQQRVGEASPRVDRASNRWSEVNPSRFAWERDGLEQVRTGLPDVAPIRAWANVEFIADDGSINEIDLIVLTGAGLFLVELKAWAGRISAAGDPTQWRWTRPGETTPRVTDNPVLATRRKAQRLRSLLVRQDAMRGHREALYVEELVFLSDFPLDCQLPPAARTRLVGRDGAQRPPGRGGDPLPSVLDVLLGHLPALDNGVVRHLDVAQTTAIARAIEQAGIRPCQAARRAGDYVLTEKLGEVEGVWEDWIGEHTSLRVHRRVRRWLAGQARTTAGEDRLRRAAQREFRFHDALRHPAIDRPLDQRDTEYGPVLLYDLHPGALALPAWLDTNADRLDLRARVQLVRQLAEVLQHAHRLRVFHRALSADVVEVLPAEDPAAAPRLRVRDWATGAREAEGLPGAVADASTTGTVHLAELIGNPSRAYLAPETFAGTPALDPATLDVFALGAVTYLLLTGRPPAADAADLRRLLREQGALDLGAAQDGATEQLRDLVRDATAASPDDRNTIEDWLAGLDLVAEALHEPDRPVEERTADPLQAAKGDVLEGGWVVEQRLGSGATAVALLAHREGSDTRRVLKIADDPAHHDRLVAEYEALARLDHPAIVHAYGVDRIGGYPALVLDFAGETTLAAELRRGNLPDLALLQRYGDDLFGALDHLEEHGVAHRDVKPDNLGVHNRPGDRAKHLVLFDFSLARAPADQLDVGTRAYLDPFLPERPSRQWDVHADRWSACVVLHELATGYRPRWPNGADPGVVRDIEVELDAAAFPEAVAPGLVTFFTRALRRNPRERFGSVAELRSAWSDVFAQVDEGTTTLDDEAQLAARLAAAHPGDALVTLGLAPRLVDALARVQAFTVGDLASVSPMAVNQARGISTRTRRLVVRLLRHARPDEAPTAPTTGLVGVDTVDGVARLLLPDGLDPAGTEARVLRAVVGLDPDVAAAWPSQGDAATAAGVSRQRVSQLVGTARERWKRIAALSALRADVAELLQAFGGVASVDELADQVLALRGSAAEDVALQRRHARAVVRAAFEADQALAEPAWVERRRGARVVVADDAHGIEGLTVAEWAFALGEVADRLVATDPLPSPAATLDALRAVAAPTGLEPLPDARLVRLAAAASAGAAASSRLDLHPVGWPAAQAVPAARPVLYGPGVLSEEAVRERVRARFPSAAPLPARPQLDELLAGIGLVWDPGEPGPDGRDAGFRPATRVGGFTTIAPTRTVFTAGARPSADVAALQRTDERLAAQVRDGGFCAWSTPIARIDAAVAELVARFDAVHVDADAVLLDALRAQAGALEVDWSVVLAADAAPTGSADRTNLTHLVALAVDAVRDAVPAAGPRVVCTGLGLLARYGHLDVVDTWRDHATGVRLRAGVPLRTLWLVLPAADPAARPTVAGTAVPVLAPAHYGELPTAWLARTPKVPA